MGPSVFARAKNGARSLPPPPSFVLWLLPHFSRGKNTKNPIPRSFFAPKPHGNACYAGYNNPYNTQSDLNHQYRPVHKTILLTGSQDF